MAISDQQFNAWLKNDNKERVVLAEAKYYNSGQFTRYLSTHGFVSGPSDTPANIVYDDLIASVPTITSQLNMPFGVGDIDLVNDGSLDAWLQDSWDGRQLLLLIGDASWSRDDFRQISSLMIESFEVASNNKMRFRVRDKRERININAQSSYFTSGAAIGKPKPLCVGKVFNITPILISAPLHKYQVHDGPINAITDVRDNGVSVAHTATLSDGTFVLSQQPVGRITCDVEGAKPQGVYHTKTADIVRYLLEREVLIGSDFDDANLTAFNNLVPYTVGVFMSSRENLISVIDLITKSTGSYWLFNRLGQLALWQLDSVTGTAIARFDADDIIDNTFMFVSSQLPVSRVAVGYQKNHTLQNDTAGAVTELNRALYADINSIAAATNADIRSTHPLAEESDTLDTLISLSADAATEAARLAAMRDVIRFTYEAEFSTGPFQIKLGDEINVTYPRFGFADGLNVIVAGLDEMPADNKIKVRFWL